MTPRLEPGDTLQDGRGGVWELTGFGPSKGGRAARLAEVNGDRTKRLNVGDLHRLLRIGGWERV